MKIQTGQGTIPLISLLAIWSISMIINIPGLAISPILSEMNHIFKGTTHLETDMLTSIPSLMIIPFVLLSGRLSEKRNKLVILFVGLVIFFISGVLCFFAKSMTYLIVVNCLLGVGAGMVVPLSTGLITDYFVGKQRTTQLGLNSAISNLSLVLATLLTGWLATINWHLQFIVYLVPIFAVILMYFLRPAFLKKNNVKDLSTVADTDTTTTSTLIKPGKRMNVAALLGLMIIYFLACYVALIIDFNVSYVVDDYKLSSVASGTLISVFFLAIMLPGFFIARIIELFKNWTIPLTFLGMGIGLIVTVLFKSVVMMGIGIFICGFFYGVLQPLLYDKVPATAIHSKAVLVLGWLMAMNYLAVLVTPFIMQFFGWVFNASGEIYPFYVNTIISVIIFVIAVIFRKKFIFSMARS